MADSLLFGEEENILCFHGPLLYEAKVQSKVILTRSLKVKSGQEEQKKGTLSTKNNLARTISFIIKAGKARLFTLFVLTRWDEWVPESRMLKFTDENLKKQSDLKESHMAKTAKKEKENKAVPVDIKKRPRDNLNDREEEFVKKPEIKILIPDALKIQLVDDWENITKNFKLIPIPKTPNVSEIVSKFMHQNMKHDQNDDILAEVCDGIKVYFDRALGNILLYRFERTQYAQILQNDPSAKMCEVYGAEHLLRLFVQMPTLIAHTNMDVEGINILKDHFVEFLRFLDTNREEFFTLEYDVAPPSYITQSKLH